MKVAQSNVEKATAALQEERMKKSHNTSHPVSPAPQENSDTRSWARSWTSMADGNRNGTSSEETAVGEDEGLPIQIQVRLYPSFPLVPSPFVPVSPSPLFPPHP